MVCGAAFRQGKVALGFYDPLTRLAARYKSDKGVTVFPFHAYTREYHQLFRPFRRDAINFLEIGLARRNDRHSLSVTCPSLNMWLDYFPHARVFGFDIDDFSGVDLPRTRILRGDQGNADDLRKLGDCCSELDVIIDDGSHASFHQHVTLKALFPFVKSGGLFVIEDLNWQPTDLEKSLPPVRKTVDLLKDRQALDAAVPGVRDVQFFCADSMAVLTKK